MGGPDETGGAGLGWSSAGSAAACFPANTQPRTLLTARTCGRWRQKREGKLKCMSWSSAPPPAPSTLAPRWLIVCWASSSRRWEAWSWPSSLTCSFPNTWKASNYPVITPFIASLRLTTFWQAFPARFSSQHRFLSTGKGAAGLLGLLLLVQHWAPCTPHPHSSQPWALGPAPSPLFCRH